MLIWNDEWTEENPFRWQLAPQVSGGPRNLLLAPGHLAIDEDPSFPFQNLCWCVTTLWWLCETKLRNLENGRTWLDFGRWIALSYFIILHQFPITGHHFFRQDEETSPGKSWPVMKAHRGYWVMRFVIEMYRIVILKGITCDNDSNTAATSYRTNGWYCCDHTTIAFFFKMSLGAHAGPYPPSLFILGIVAYEKTALLCCHGIGI